MKVLELFAGVGGFRVGLENVDKNFFETKWSNQWEPSRKSQDAFEVYDYHFPNSKNINISISEISDNQLANMDADMIVGGFPCQDYSVARSKKNEQGIDEEFRYEVTMTSKNVQREALYQKTSRSFSYIFERTHQDELKNYKHRSFLAPALADDVNDNVSLLAYAFLLDNPIAVRVIQFFSQMTFNLHTAGRRESSDADLYRMAELFSKRASLKQQAEQLLCQFDTGISKINFAPVIMVDENKKQKEVLMPMGVHQHDGESLEFLFTDESNGTRSAFILLGMILPVLERGGMAIIDEIDNDLHPHLLPHLIDLFKFEHTNPHQAQLIFSCHTPEVLNILKKHQIYLVQKENQESEAWRLDEVVGVRADDNLYAKYMAGAFDAVPNV